MKVAHREGPADGDVPLDEQRGDRLVTNEFDAGRGCERLAREVVLGRAEPAGDDDGVGTVECAADELDDALDVVTDDGVGDDV